MYKRVEVTWLDSEGLDKQGWHDIDEIETFCESLDMTCTTCGYLIADRPEYLVIALSISIHDGDPSQIDGIIKIPRCAVQKISHWKEKKDA